MSARTRRAVVNLTYPSYAAANAALYWAGEHEGASTKANEATSIWRTYHSPDFADMLSAVEDVWLRLASNEEVKFAMCWDALEQKHTLMFRFRHEERDPQTLTLLEVAANSALYKWQDGGHLCKLYSSLQWIGDTLIVELQSRERLSRMCVDGDIELRIRETLNRISKV